MIDQFLKSKMKLIEKLCITHEVVRLHAFGSIVDGRFKRGKSDIDMMVEFDSRKSKKVKSRNLLKLWIDLQSILDSKVDLISSENIEGEYFKKYLELYKVRIFERNTEANRVDGREESVSKTVSMIINNKKQ